MLKLIRLVGHAGTAIALFMVAFASAGPSRAEPNIDACFNTVADAVGTVADAAQNLGAFAANPECTPLLSPPTDFLFAGVTAVVTAADIAGAFGGQDYDSCVNAIDHVLVSAITAALDSALDGGSPLSPVLDALGDDVKNQIRQMALDLATNPAVIDQIKDALSALPVVGQAIDMLPCACRLATAVIQGANDVVQTVSDAGDCAEFALNCVSSPLQCVGSLFESGLDAIADLAEAAWDFISSALDDISCAAQNLCHSIPLIGDLICDPCEHPPPPPPPTQVDCIGGATLSGDVRDLGNGAKVSLTSNQYCSCPPTMQWRQNGDTWSCVCPLAGQIQVAAGICQCPAGQALRDGICQPCPPGTIAKYGACTCAIAGEVLVNNVCRCPDGQQVAGNHCVTPCTDPTQVLLADGKCCPPNKVSACGICCGAKQVPDPKSGSCVSSVVARAPRPNLTPISPPLSAPSIAR